MNFSKKTKLVIIKIPINSNKILNKINKILNNTIHKILQLTLLNKITIISNIMVVIQLLITIILFRIRYNINDFIFFILFDNDFIL